MINRKVKQIEREDSSQNFPLASISLILQACDSVLLLSQ
jgi:hypothetical protein